jgi:hypothetical protein
VSSHSHDPSPFTKTAGGRAVISISASNGWMALVMSNSLRRWDEKTAATKEGRTFEGAAFSKTLLN